MRINRGAMEFVVGTVRFRFDVNFLAGARDRRERVEFVPSTVGFRFDVNFLAGVRIRRLRAEFVFVMGPSWLDVNFLAGVRTRRKLEEFVLDTVRFRLDAIIPADATSKQGWMVCVTPTTLYAITLLESTTITPQPSYILSTPHI